VEDLHRLIPHSFIELGLGIFHEVPYQTAQKHNIPLQGVYVAQSGFVFGEAVKTDGVILEINGAPCGDLSSFEEQLRLIPNQEYFSITWMLPGNFKERSKSEGSAKMQRHWGTCRAWTLEHTTRTWSPRPLEGPQGGGQDQGEAASTEALEVAFELHEEQVPAAAPSHLTPAPAPGSSTTEVPESPTKKARKSQQQGLAAHFDRCICAVHFRTVQTFDLDVIVDTENQEADTISCHGSAVVLDAAAGLVLTDRATVPQPLGDIEVTLGDLCRSAAVWFMHPLHSLVVLRLDKAPDAEGDGPFGQSAVFSEQACEVGDTLTFLGYDSQGRRLTSPMTVQNVRPGDFPTHWPPRWRERNLEALILSDGPGNASSGILCDGQGRVCALHAVATLVEEGQSHRLGYGLPMRNALPLLEHLRAFKGIPVARWPLPRTPSLEVEFKSMELPKLRRLPAKIRPSVQWLDRLVAMGTSALRVVGVTSKGPCDGAAAEGDLLVAVNGETVTTVGAVEQKLQQAVSVNSSSAATGEDQMSVKLTFLRRGKEREVTVPIQLLASDGAKRILSWHGLILQETPRAVRELGAVPAGVYISQTALGSPGEASNVEGEFLLAVDGVPTPTLDAVIALSAKSTAPPQGGGDLGRHLRVESGDLSGRRFMKTLAPDPLFWTTCEMVQNHVGVWSCVEHAM
jgi:S1-C subfamily serine protease